MSLTDDLKDDLIRTIQLKGSIESGIKPIIAVNADGLINRSSGLARIQSHLVKKFSLILSQPLALATLNPLNIKCCLCNKIISYPAWYHHIEYSVNEFHYFVCFNGKSANKVTAACFNRKIGG